MDLSCQDLKNYDCKTISYMLPFSFLIMLEKQPYIEITGISTFEEAEIIAKNFQIQLLGLRTHKPMSGYLVSQKTLSGDTTSPESYPFIGMLPKLLAITSPTSSNAIHYST